MGRGGVGLRFGHPRQVTQVFPERDHRVHPVRGQQARRRGERMTARVFGSNLFLKYLPCLILPGLQGELFGEARC